MLAQTQKSATKQLTRIFPHLLRFLENEQHVSLVERHTFLYGYELYLVEQWACSRKSPTLVVATHTGDGKDRISAGILAIPADDTLWSARLRLYFKAANQYHARPKETGQGQLLVTNLSNFPSSLTVISVPDGDIRKHRQTFIVNEDLKRLGCSGRSGLTLTEPTEATRSKFHQLYKTSERIPFMQSVTELVKLCQVALYMFDKLEPEYIDGLLCDVTEAAVSDWWTVIGAEHYNYEPSDGILGPSTVAALLGMLMGARNRLSWQGAPVSKDVFDIESTKRGISYFQKAQKLDKTRRLDRQTLFRLHNYTAKAAAGEGWGVQKAVKSTVTEIGGKRGEIVMDMVSGKDKGGLADIETLDLDRFVKLVYGEQPKWLWYGKQRRAPLESRDLDHEVGHHLIHGRGELSAPVSRRTTGQQPDDEVVLRRAEDTQSAPPSRIATSTTYDSYGDRDGTRRTVFQSVAGNAKSGLGRIKDAVGASRRAHGRWPSSANRDDVLDNLHTLNLGIDSARASGIVAGPSSIGRAFTWKETPEEYLAALRRGDPEALRGLQGTHLEPASADTTFSQNKTQLGEISKSSAIGNLEAIGTEVREDVLSRAPSAVRSAIDETDLEGPLLEAERTGDQKHLRMCRRHSSPNPRDLVNCTPNENRYPRRLSFGDAEEAILDWEEINLLHELTDDDGAAAAQTEVLGRLAEQMDLVVNGIGPWVGEQIKLVAALDDRYGKDVAEIQIMYHQLNEACERVRLDSEGIIAEEQRSLEHSIKELETMIARLEYEINALVVKVHDVEDGILVFERQVADVEKRAEELKTQLETESWPHWLVRTLTGVGTGPNITRSV